MADNPAEFILESKEWDDLLKKLKRKYKDIEDRKEFGGIVSSVVYKDIMEHFDKEKGPDGKWQKWSDVYEKHLKKIGRSGNKILSFSGKLRQAFLPTNYKSMPEGVLFFNRVKYAKRHDEGLAKMPKRKFMYLSPAGIKSLVEQTLKWLSE